MPLIRGRKDSERIGIRRNRLKWASVKTGASFLWNGFMLIERLPLILHLKSESTNASGILRLAENNGRVEFSLKADVEMLFRMHSVGDNYIELGVDDSLYRYVLAGESTFDAPIRLTILKNSNKGSSYLLEGSFPSRVPFDLRVRGDLDL